MLSFLVSKRLFRVWGAGGARGALAVFQPRWTRPSKTGPGSPGAREGRWERIPSAGNFILLFSRVGKQEIMKNKNQKWSLWSKHDLVSLSERVKRKRAAREGEASRGLCSHPENQQPLDLTVPPAPTPTGSDCRSHFPRIFPEPWDCIKGPKGRFSQLPGTLPNRRCPLKTGKCSFPRWCASPCVSHQRGRCWESLHVSHPRGFIKSLEGGSAGQAVHLGLDLEPSRQIHPESLSILVSPKCPLPEVSSRQAPWVPPAQIPRATLFLLTPWAQNIHVILWTLRQPFVASGVRFWICWSLSNVSV